MLTKKLLNRFAISVESSIRVPPTFTEVTLDCLCFTSSYLLKKFVDTALVAFIIIDECLILKFLSIVN